MYVKGPIDLSITKIYTNMCLMVAIARFFTPLISVCLNPDEKNGSLASCKIHPWSHDGDEQTLEAY